MNNQLLAELEMANKKIEEKDKEIERLKEEIDYLKGTGSLKILNDENKRLNNIINELEKTFDFDDKRIKEYNIEHPERPLDNYSRYYLDKLKELKGDNNEKH